MRNKGSQIKNHKLRGEWAELRFMARAAEHGLGVSKPWGESARYDVGVEHNGRFLRVQVKSTIYQVGQAYVCNTRPDNDHQPYTCGQIDFMAAYVIPEDVWYILPARVATALKGNIWLSPHKPGHKYQQYMEAWQLLRREPRVQPLPSGRSSAKLEASCGREPEQREGGSPQPKS
jgi:PD-(D/E)XK endonuclease